MPGRILMTAAILGAAGLAAQAGEPKRVWTDPPREAAAPVQERPAAEAQAAPPRERPPAEAQAASARERSPAEAQAASARERPAAAGQGAQVAWPDEGSRRRLHAGTSASSPARPAESMEPGGEAEPARRPPDGLQPVAGATAAAAAMAAPDIARRTKRRLGPLAGFAGAAAAPRGQSGASDPAGDAVARPDPERPRPSNLDAARGDPGRIQPAFGRMRILQLRRGRVVVIYTRS